MKKKTMVIIVVAIIMIFFCVIISLGNINTKNANVAINDSTSIKAVIVKVNKNSLIVMQTEKDEGLINVSFSKEGNIGFKEGQEILIDFDGMITLSYPASISNVKKIKILNEKTNIIIPEKHLKYCFSSKNKVKISLIEITDTKIGLDIVDENERQYNYPDSYSIEKKVENTENISSGQKIGEDTSNSLAGFTRNRFKICL